MPVEQPLKHLENWEIHSKEISYENSKDERLLETL
jgi:hypothetical protein